MRWLAALGALGVFLSIGRARAQERPSEVRASAAPSSPSATEVVTITVAGDPDPRAMDATLSDLFAYLPEGSTRPLAIDVKFAAEIAPQSITDPPADPPPAFARVWIDMRADTCLVSIADAKWERIYQRRVPRPPGNDDVTREQVAHVVVSTVEAMLAGGSIGVSRAELTPPVATKPPPVPPEAPLAPEPPRPRPLPGGAMPAATLAVGYEAMALASATWVHGPSASLRGALSEGPWAVGLGLLAQWRAPIVVDQAPIGVRIDTRALRLILDVERSLTPRIVLHMGAGPGLDLSAIEPRGVSRSGEGGEPTITVETKRSRVSPVLRWSLGVDVRLAPSLRIGIAGVLDLALSNRSYIVRQQGIPRDVLAPFDLRPGLTLTLVAELVRR